MSTIGVRKRARKPKVKTGCQTCKIRHIKCDEGRPACMKCRNTGRKCDGYRSSTPILPTRNPMNPQNSLTNLPCIINGNEQEIRSFQYFIQCTIPAISSYFMSSFWTSLILPASHVDPAILHAVIAFGSVHEMHGSSQQSSQSSPNQANSRFALQQSNKALRHLSSQISSSPNSNSPSRSGEIILMSCLLFVFLETFQRNYGAALSHLECGLKILGSWIHSPHSSSSPSSQAAQFPATPIIPPNTNMSFIHENLVPIFRLLDLQASTYLTARPIHRDALSNPAGVDINTPLQIPGQFSNLQEANDILHDLLHYMIHYTQSSLLHLSSTPGDPIPHLPPSMLSRFLHAQKTHHVLLDQYLVSLNGFLRVHDMEDLPAEALRGVVVLKIKHLAAVILNGACVADHEMGFDGYMGEFERVVRLSESLVKKNSDSGVRERGKEGGGTGRGSYSFDMNILAPLYHTVCRCRDPVIRRRALALLRGEVRREGMWDSEVLSAIGGWVLEEEEGGLGRVVGCEEVGIERRICIIDRIFGVGGRRCLVRYYRGVRGSEGGVGVLEKMITW